MVRVRLAALMIALGLVAGAPRALADRAEAKEHFEAGLRLKRAGELDEACEAFARSHASFPSVGALLNLGDCRERQGRLASAWRLFGEAARFARDRDDRERARYSRERIAKLEERLSFITIDVPATVRAIAGLIVELDGEPIDAGQLGRAIAADAGAHRIRARAPGHAPFEASIELGRERDRKSVTVVLERRAIEPATSNAGAAAPTTPAIASSDDRGATSGRRIAALSLLGGAAVSAGAGAVLGLQARSRWNDAQACEATATCEQADVDLADSARTRANLSTAAFVVAAAAAGIGAWLYLSDGDDAAGTRVSVSPGGVTVAGRF